MVLAYRLTSTHGTGRLRRPAAYQRRTTVRPPAMTDAPNGTTASSKEPATTRRLEYEHHSTQILLSLNLAAIGTVAATVTDSAHWVTLAVLGLGLAALAAYSRTTGQ